MSKIIRHTFLFFMKGGYVLIEYILFAVYIAWSWWALNVIWYNRHVIVFHDGFLFYGKKLILSAFFGWALIPIAVIMKILHI